MATATVTAQTTFAVIPAQARKAWVAALRAAKPLAAGKGYPMPVLRAVLLTPIVGGGIRLAATDLTTYHAADLPGEMDGPLCLVHADLLAFLGAGSGQAAICREDGGIEASDAGGTAQLASFDPDEFPLVPEIPDTAPLVLPAGTLARALGAVVPAVCNDIGRGVLQGVLLEADAAGLTLVGTDAFRLHHAVVPVPEGSPTVRLLLRGRAAGYLAATLPVTGEASIRHNASGQMHVEAEGHRWTMVTMGDHYVNWRQIVPKASVPWCSVGAKDLAAAVKAAAGSTSRTVELAEGQGAVLTVSTAAASRTVPCAPLAGAGAGAVLFQASFLRDALAPLGRGEATLLRPVGGKPEIPYPHTIAPAEGHLDGFAYQVLIMPWVGGHRDR